MRWRMKKKKKMRKASLLLRGLSACQNEMFNEPKNTHFFSRDTWLSEEHSFHSPSSVCRCVYDFIFASFCTRWLIQFCAVLRWAWYFKLMYYYYYYCMMFNIQRSSVSMIKGVRIVYFTLTEPFFDYHYYCLYMKPKHCKYPTILCLLLLLSSSQKCPIIMDTRCIKSFSKKRNHNNNHICVLVCLCLCIWTAFSSLCFISVF